MEVVDNKTGVPLSHYLEVYKSIDKDEVLNRCNINYNSEFDGFEFTFLNTKMVATWPEFSLKIQSECKFSSVFESPYAKILVIRFLCEQSAAAFNGKFLTYREMPWGEVYDNNFNGRCRMRLAYAFGNNIECFCKACELLGGRKLELGDASYELPVFENMLIRLVIYEGDDEFPPSSQFLFSDNMALSFSAEDRCVFGDLIINSLKVLSKEN